MGKILLVDRNLHTCDYLMLALEDAGYAVTRKGRAEEVLRDLNTKSYEVYIVDLTTGDLSRSDRPFRSDHLIPKIREAKPSAYIIAISAAISGYQAMSEGRNIFVDKSFEWDERIIKILKRDLEDE